MNNTITLQNCNVSINNYIIKDEKSQFDINVLEQYKINTQKNTNVLQAYFLGLNKKAKAKRVEECFSFLTFKNYKDINVTKLYKANLCRERLCLNCQSAKSLQLSQIIRYIIAKEKCRMLTFTIKNCKAEELRYTIQNMKKALKALFRKENVRDYFCKVEITYNEKENTFHPHLHILTSAKNMTYKKSVLRRKWLLEVRKKIYCDSNFLMCDNKIIDNNFKSILELSKYITKPVDLFIPSVIKTYDIQLKGLRLVEFSGMFKTFKEEAEDKAKKEKSEEEIFLNDFDYDLINYIWNGANYEQYE